MRTSRTPLRSRLALSFSRGSALGSARASALVFALVFAFALAGCSDGGGGGGALDTGTLSFFVTDAPSDDFDRIELGLSELTLIGGGAPVTLFEGRRTIDLKQLEDVTDLFLMAEGVPARSYSKIRLGVSDVTLVREAAGDDPGVALSIDPPANGKIDLNPRGPFEVRPGGHLVIEIDIDAEKSIHLRPDGHDGYGFRPVVFVEIGERLRPTKPARVTGWLKERLGDDRFVLCPSYAFGRRTLEGGTRVPCVVVRTDPSTGIFDLLGDPATLDDLTWLPDSAGERGPYECEPGDGIPTHPDGAIDDLESAVSVELDGVPTEGCPYPTPIDRTSDGFYAEMNDLEAGDARPLVITSGPVEPVDVGSSTELVLEWGEPIDPGNVSLVPYPIPVGYATVIGFFDGGLVHRESAASLEPRMRAVTVEEGGPFVWRTLSGLLFESEAEGGEGPPRLYFEADPGQGFSFTPVREALVQDGTRMFDREGHELDFDLEGRTVRVKIDTVAGPYPPQLMGDPLITPETDPEPYAYRLAFVAFETVVEPDPWPDPEPRWLSGHVTEVDPGGLAIAIETEEGFDRWYSVREDVIVHFAYSSPGGAVSRPGELGEIEPGMRVEALLEAEGPPPIFGPEVSLIVSFTAPASGDACTSNDDCDAAEYCERPFGTCWGEGVCAVRPQACLQIFDPVCGCDERSYSNACEAAAAGTNVRGEAFCVVPL